MQSLFLKTKIHPATLTDANLYYEGSLTLDIAIMEAAHIQEYEKVLVVDINNGNRFETYVIKGERDSKIVCANGAAARLVHRGDQIIIMTFALLNNEEIKSHKPTIIKLSLDNDLIK